MDKVEIVRALKEQLREQYSRAIAAVQDAADAATGEDSKAESKYDTRGLEASYLAAGQVAQADQLKRELAAVEAFDFPNLSDDSPIKPGALVEAKLDGQTVHYLLAPGGGGLTIDIDDGGQVTVLGIEAPLRGNLLDQKVGGSVERPPLEITGIR
jgi:hypothetical protein